ncbi:MAG: carboxypeptidase regulatory-like domain-containing protein [Candidatus Acidiferrum sp.]
MKPFKSGILYFVFFAMLCVFCGVGASAQDATGRVTGIIFDPSGATIAGANVTVTNVGTQISRETVSDTTGFYQVLALPVGSYTVSVERQGFRSATTSPSKLEINQTLKIDIKMEVGAAAETVTVESTTGTVETINPTLGSTVSERTVQDMPLNGRNALDLALLQPGVLPADNPSNGSGGTGGMQFSIGGGRSDSNTFVLDGGLNNDLLDNGVVYNPNPDSIQEFRVLTSNFTAEYGRSAGGIITEVTKSGTNAFHGSAYDFVRNTIFDANNFFSNLDGQPRQTLHRNQYGGTVGGPIKRDKLFFFLAYQKQDLSEESVSSQVTLPTAAELQGNFSGSPNQAAVASFLQANPLFQPNAALAAQGIINPASIDPVAQAYIKAGLIPTSNSPTGAATFQNPLTDNPDEWTGKLDYEASPKDHFTATFGRILDPQLNPGPGGIPGYGSTSDLYSRFFNLAYIRTFSPSILNEFRATAQRSDTLQRVPASHQPTSTGLGINILSDNPTGPTQLDFPNATIGFSIQGPSRLVDNTFAYSDVLSWTHGKHTMRFGGSISAYQDNQVFEFEIDGQFFYSTSGAAGDPFANFLVGLPDFYDQGPAAPSDIRTKATYVFGQDEWHVANNLTLTYGLRYEYSTPKSDTEGRTYSVIPGAPQSTVFPGAPLGLVFPGDKGAPNGANFPDKTNFAPRIGFAWQPFHDGKTSVRGGWGIFYDVLKAEDNFQFNGQVPFASAAFIGNFTPQGPATTTGFGFQSDPFGSTGNPDPFDQPLNHSVIFADTFGTFTSNGTGATIVNPNLRTPYTYQYNLSIEHQVSNKLVARAAYVGSSSHGLTTLVDIDPFDPATLNSPNPQRFLNERPGNLPAFTNSDPNGVTPPGFNPNVPDGSFGQEQEFENAANANYNALQLSLTQQTTNLGRFGGVYYTLGYTWAHSIDNASGFRQGNFAVPFFDPQLFRASSDFDVRQYVTFSGGWDLPFSRGPQRLVKGWSLYPILTWRTGFPFTAIGGFNTLDNAPGPTGAGDQGLINANLTGPVQYLNPKTNGLQFFSQSTFNDNVVQGYGTAPRNVLRGPGRTNLDLSLAKTTPLYHERITLELRVDAFNLFNHTEFENLDNDAQDIGSTFGQVVSAYDPRILQVAAHLRF